MLDQAIYPFRIYPVRQKGWTFTHYAQPLFFSNIHETALVVKKYITVPWGHDPFWTASIITEQQGNMIIFSSTPGAVDSMPGTKASTSHGTLSTTTEASNNGTIIPGMLSSTTPSKSLYPFVLARGGCSLRDRKTLSITLLLAGLVIGCVSLVIFCALVGISLFFYKR